MNLQRIKAKLLIYLHTDHILDLYVYKHLCMEAAVLTLSEFKSAFTHCHTLVLRCGLLHSAHLFLRCMSSGECTPHRMSVCCHGDGLARACVLHSLSTEERKCDLMPCPDSALTWLQRCSVQRSQLSVSVWSHIMSAASELDQSHRQINC